MAGRCQTRKTFSRFSASEHFFTSQEIPTRWPLFGLNCLIRSHFSMVIRQGFNKIVIGQEMVITGPGISIAERKRSIWDLFEFLLCVFYGMEFTAQAFGGPTQTANANLERVHNWLNGAFIVFYNPTQVGTLLFKPLVFFVEILIRVI